MDTQKKIISLIALFAILAAILLISGQLNKPSLPTTSYDQIKEEAASQNLPIISDLRSEPLSKTSVYMSWKTSLPTQTILGYTVDPNAVEIIEVKDPTLKTTHAIEVTNLP
jgi:hypothetical protein